MEKIMTKNEMISVMECKKNIFDIVRIVNPKTNEVMELNDGKIYVKRKTPCFSVWNKKDHCRNCISLNACLKKTYDEV